MQVALTGADVGRPRTRVGARSCPIDLRPGGGYPRSRQRVGLHMDHIEVSGLRIAYERAGQGPPLVLLHGFVGDGRATWGRQLEGLSDEFTVIAWDAPGAGRSSDPPASF